MCVCVCTGDITLISRSAPVKWGKWNCRGVRLGGTLSTSRTSVPESAILSLACHSLFQASSQANSHYHHRHACLSVRPSVLLHGTTQLPPKEYSWNFIFVSFSKTLRYCPNWDKYNIHLTPTFTSLVFETETCVLCEVRIEAQQTTDSLNGSPCTRQVQE